MYSAPATGFAHIHHPFESCVFFSPVHLGRPEIKSIPGGFTLPVLAGLVDRWRLEDKQRLLACWWWKLWAPLASLLFSNEALAVGPGDTRAPGWFLCLEVLWLRQSIWISPGVARGSAYTLHSWRQAETASLCSRRGWVRLDPPGHGLQKALDLGFPSCKFRVLISMW